MRVAASLVSLVSLVSVVLLSACGGPPENQDPGTTGGGTGGEVGGGAGGEVGGGAGGDVGGGTGGDVGGGTGGDVGGGTGGSVGGGTGGSVSGGTGGSVGGGTGGSVGGGTGGSMGGGTGGATGVELNAGWIGGACVDVSSCNAPGYTATASCLTTGFPGGFCTQACTLSSSSTSVCPDAASVGGSSGNTVTRCINAAGSPSCAAECDFTQSPTGCRPGYTCTLRQRYGQSSKIFKVCMPEPDQRWPGEAAPANDIGAACASDSACAHNSCLAVSGGYCTKTMCDYAGCPSGSTCFGTGNGQTACLKDCTQTSQCRTSEGYACTSQSVCLPGTTGTTWNSSFGAGDCLAAWGTAGSGLSPCDTVKDSYIVVRKSARNVALCEKGSLVANFQAGLGFAPVGDKVQEGDGKTPEGVFFAAQLVPQSSYYKAFLLSYPDKGDATRGLSSGLISASEKTAIDTAQDACTTPPQTTQLGSYVEVHGRGGTSDWTLGCVALDDTSIDQLWNALQVKDTIVILP